MRARSPAGTSSGAPLRQRLASSSWRDSDVVSPGLRNARLGSQCPQMCLCGTSDVALRFVRRTNPRGVLRSRPVGASLTTHAGPRHRSPLASRNGSSLCASDPCSHGSFANPPSLVPTRRRRVQHGLSMRRRLRLSGLLAQTVDSPAYPRKVAYRLVAPGLVSRAQCAPLRQRLAGSSWRDSNVAALTLAMFAWTAVSRLGRHAPLHSTTPHAASLGPARSAPRVPTTRGRAPVLSR